MITRLEIEANCFNVHKNTVRLIRLVQAGAGTTLNVLEETYDEIGETMTNAETLFVQRVRPEEFQQFCAEYLQTQGYTVTAPPYAPEG